MRALWELARHQLGLITRPQAVQLVSRHEFEHLVRKGHLRRMRRGVWAVAGVPPSYEQSVLAVVLAAGFPAMASHRTAAKLHGLKVPPPERIDVLTLPNRRLRLEGVDHHRGEQIPVSINVRGVPASPVGSTLVDCAPWLPGRMFGLAVDDARRRALVTAADVEAAHAFRDRGRSTGRHLVVPARPALADRHHAGGSERELDVLRILRRAGLPLPVQQHEVVVGGRRRILDYAYPLERVYLEWDGFAEHGLLRTVFDDDRDRDAELGLAGWLGLHFTSNTPDSTVADRVGRALLARSS